jgi:uncharacterized protein YdcH (DUF465 family)
VLKGESFMSISGIETKHQNYAPSSNHSPKISSCDSESDSFKNAVVNWEKRIKENIDKEKENDRSGNIQMSDKQWRHLMEKVDSAINALKNNIKEREKEEKKQLQEKKLTLKDTITVNI